MAINPFMRAVLNALSYTDIDVKKNYMADRIINNITHPSLNLLYEMWDHKIMVDEYELPVRRELFLHSTPLETAGDRIILMGDSAGGNLAAVVSLMAADRGEFKVEKQILLYPSTYNDHSEASKFPSIIENGKGFLLTSKKICDYQDLYIQKEEDLTNPYFAPLLSNHLEHQPKTLLITAEYDPLRDEGEAYGEKLREFGNEVVTYRMKEALHGFFSLPLRFAHVKQCYKQINVFLNG